MAFFVYVANPLCTFVLYTPNWSNNGVSTIHYFT